MPMHRAEFQQALIKHLPKSCESHFHKRLVSYKAGPGGVIVLHFADGSTAECDILIGADGIKSVVRQTLFTELASSGKVSHEEAETPNPVWSGTVAYRGLIPKDVLERRFPGHRALKDDIMYCGKNKHLVVFPIQKGEKVNVVAFCSDPSAEGKIFSDDPASWVTDVSRDELLKQYLGWEDEVIALLECIDKPSRWAINTVKPLSTFVSERVALIGDAAHAMTPNLGSGAGQAIEDAYVLSALLSSPKYTNATLGHVLNVYDQIRRPRAQNVAELSRTNGLLYEFNAPGYEYIQSQDSNVSPDKLDQLGREAREHWEWAWSTSADGDIDTALSML